MKDMDTQTLDRWIGLVRTFIPKHINVEDEKQLAMYHLFHELEEYKTKLNSVRSAKECDATDDASSNAV